MTQNEEKINRLRDIILLMKYENRPYKEIQKAQQELDKLIYE